MGMGDAFLTTILRGFFFFFFKQQKQLPASSTKLAGPWSLENQVAQR